MSLDPRLVHLQARLLEGLADGVPPAQARSAAHEDAPDAAVARWVADWDEDLLELAGVLVRSWARRDPPA